MRRLTLILLLIVLASAGCSYTMPPGKIPMDRGNYFDAVSTSWKEQLLSNLVRLRYGDTLTSLEMTNVITSYELDTNLSAGYPVNWHPLSGTTGFRNTVSVGGFVTYSDKPAITYVPTRGDALAKTMIEPLDPSRMLKSLQTGWDADYIFACCLKSINQLRNRTSSGSIPADPRFFDLVGLFADLKANGVIRITVEEPVEPTVTTVPQEYTVTLKDERRKKEKVDPVLTLPMKAGTKPKKGNENGGGTDKKKEKNEDSAIGKLELDKDRAEYLDNKPDEKHAEPSGTKKITTMVEIDTAKGKLKGTFKDKIQEFKDLLRIKVSPKLEPMYKSNCCGCHGAKGDGDGPDKADLKPANFNNPKFWVGDVDQKIDQAVQKGHEEIPKKEITKLRNMKDDDLNAVKAFIKQAFGRYEVYKIINGNQYILQTGQYCDKIVLQTRSILEVLNMLSLFINVPTEHITEGLVKESPLVNKPLNGPGGGSEKMFYIEYGKERPSDAFVAVKYHEYWFYIVNGDFDSKNVFSSTAGILSLSETATPSTGAPVLTLPVQ